MSRKYSAKTGIIFTVLFVFNLLNNNVLAGEFAPDLILVGGALKTCSSMSPKQCENSEIIVNGKQQLFYGFSAERLKRLQSTTAFQGLADTNRQQLNTIISGIYAKNASDKLTKSAFLDELDEAGDDLDIDNFVRHLPDNIYYALLDTHETVQTLPNGDRLKEIVSVADNKNPYSSEIYDAFIHRATELNKGEKPRIVVITASSRDLFESADFYEGAMASAGAQVQWLPLSAALQHALWLNAQGLQGCESLASLHEQRGLFDISRRYPQRAAAEYAACLNPASLITAVSQAHGIFFNGGDQSKTLASLLTPLGEASEVLSTITRRINAKQLVVGGTSAGTAVQAGGVFGEFNVPMLTNGTSAAAFSRGVITASAPSVRCAEPSLCNYAVKGDDMTLRANGGTGLFSLGLLDTHFSERNREPRLIMSTLASHQRFGFGVDETTALLVDFAKPNVTMQVIGAGGVFVTDLAEHQYQQFVKDGRTVRQVGGLASFMPAGASAAFDGENLNIVLPQGEMLRKVRLREDEARWRSAFRRQCHGKRPQTWRDDGLNVIAQAGSESVFSESERDCGYTQVPFVINN